MSRSSDMYKLLAGYQKYMLVNVRVTDIRGHSPWCREVPNWLTFINKSKQSLHDPNITGITRSVWQESSLRKRGGDTKIYTQALITSVHCDFYLFREPLHHCSQWMWVLVNAEGSQPEVESLCRVFKYPSVVHSCTESLLLSSVSGTSQMMVTEELDLCASWSPESTRVSFEPFERWKLLVRVIRKGQI